MLSRMRRTVRIPGTAGFRRRLRGARAGWRRDSVRRTMRRARKPGEDRKPQGLSLQASARGARCDGAGKLHEPGEPDLEGKRRGPPWGDAEPGRGGHRRVAGRSSGRRRSLQRKGVGRAGGARCRGPCGDGTRGAEACRNRQGAPPGDAADGRTDGESRGPGALCPAERFGRGSGQWMAEAPHGWIKEVMGFRRFGVRGLEKVRGEWNLVCLALNAKRMAAALAG